MFDGYDESAQFKSTPFSESVQTLHLHRRLQPGERAPDDRHRGEVRQRKLGQRSPLSHLTGNLWGLDRQAGGTQFPANSPEVPNKCFRT